MSWPIEALLAGRAQPFRGAETSAIGKDPLPGNVAIAALGLDGDEQADRKVHGGPHMAVHQYPLDHHDFWRGEIGDHPLLSLPGAFGSNMAVRGLMESDVHIGDRFRLGTALVEISQPRQPCWKIEHRFGHKGMVATILKSGRCGWYYRVIESGAARAGDALVPEQGGDTDWPVARTFHILWGDPKSASDAELRALAQLEVLSPKLRAKAAQRLEQ